MSRESLLAIEGEMNQQFINRKDEVHGQLLAAVSKSNLLQLGPPGTAKSQLQRRFADYIQAQHFSWLLTQFTTPEEIVGPVSLQSLKEDTHRRVTTNKLPEAETAFIDEIFKAGSPILNTMLTLLEERLFYNDGGTTKCPLIFCAAASNELPDEDEGLAALYDRFLLRYNVTYLDSGEQIGKLLRLDPDAARYAKPMTVGELRLDIDAAYALVLSDEAHESIVLLQEELHKEGYIFSDRRIKQLVRVMAAESWLLEQTEIVSDSLIVAEHIFWDKPEQIRVIRQIVHACVNPAMARANDIKEAAQEAIQAINASDFVDRQELLQIAQQLRAMGEEISRLPQRSGVTEVGEWLKKTQADLVERMLKGETAGVLNPDTEDVPALGETLDSKFDPLVGRIIDR